MVKKHFQTLLIHAKRVASPDFSPAPAALRLATKLLLRLNCHLGSAGYRQATMMLLIQLRHIKVSLQALQPKNLAQYRGYFEPPPIAPCPQNDDDDDDGFLLPSQMHLLQFSFILILPPSVLTTCPSF
jgi:hypothetical protein